jgi:hypothetical protein
MSSEEESDFEDDWIEEESPVKCLFCPVFNSFNAILTHQITKHNFDFAATTKGTLLIHIYLSQKILTYIQKLS